MRGCGCISVVLTLLGMLAAVLVASALASALLG